jgi:hypothetical protein
VVQKWCRSGAEVVQKWCRSGAEVVQKWCRSGAEVVVQKLCIDTLGRWCALRYVLRNRRGGVRHRRERVKERGLKREREREAKRDRQLVYTFRFVRLLSSNCIMGVDLIFSVSFHVGMDPNRNGVGFEKGGGVSESFGLKNVGSERFGFDFLGLKSLGLKSFSFEKCC